MATVTEVAPDALPSEMGMSEEVGRAVAAQLGIPYESGGTKTPSGAEEEKPGDDGIVLTPEDKGRYSFVMPDGLKVIMGSPGVATPLIAARILAGLGPEMAQNMSAMAYVRSMLYVLEVNGEVVKRPSSAVEMQHLMNTVGDSAADIIMQVYATKWAGARLADLPLSGR